MPKTKHHLAPINGATYSSKLDLSLNLDSLQTRPEVIKYNNQVLAELAKTKLELTKASNPKHIRKLEIRIVELRNKENECRNRLNQFKQLETLLHENFFKVAKDILPDELFGRIYLKAVGKSV